MTLTSWMAVAIFIAGILLAFVIPLPPQQAEIYKALGTVLIWMANVVLLMWIGKLRVSR
jgi:hypothetical protein